MADNTGISWADATWNPVIGCAKVATGCTNCYAEKMSKRLAAMGQADYASILDDKGRFNGSALPRPEKLDQPLRWQKPRRIFVNSMSDPFHKDVPFEFIAAVFGVMAARPQHRFQVLTKRPELMREFFEWFYRDDEAMGKAHVALVRYLPDSDFDPDWVMDEDEPRKPGDVATYAILESVDWDSPLPNVELYVSAATQEDVDANVPILLQCPAAIRGLSLEPQVERVDVSPYLKSRRVVHMALDIEGSLKNKRFEGFTENGKPLHPEKVEAELRARHERGEKRFPMGDCDAFSTETGCPGHPEPRLDIIIQGGESGPNARPFDVAWARYTRDQCRDAGVMYHLKQLGANAVYDKADVMAEVANVRLAKVELMLTYPTDHRAGADPAEWPEDLQGCQDLPGMEVNR